MRKKSDTYDAIMNAARSAFAENGYEATSVDSLVRRAGVSKGAFYWHFPSKWDLFTQLMKQEVERTASDTLAGFEGASLAETVRSIGERLLESTATDGHARLLSLEARMGALRGNEEMKDLLAQLDANIERMTDQAESVSRLDEKTRTLLHVILDGLLMNLGLRLTLEECKHIWQDAVSELLGKNVSE